MMAQGGALAATAAEVVKKGLELAAKDLEVARVDIEFRDGRYHVKGTDLSAGFSEIVERHGAALDTLGGIPAPSSFPSGAHVAEGEIDPETAGIEVLYYVAVDECERVINHTLLEGQRYVGVTQGLGHVHSGLDRYET